MALDQWLTERAKLAVMTNPRIQGDTTQLTLCVQGPNEPLPTYIKYVADEWEASIVSVCSTPPLLLTHAPHQLSQFYLLLSPAFHLTSSLNV